jgi:Rrf2 family nitric oxide-sensitive transcriptional repressor
MLPWPSGEEALRLTLYTDYALRLLMYLAAVGEQERVTISAVADAYGIAHNHLTKVAHQLSLAGFIKTARGKGGGLSLARAATQISLGDVVRRTEPDMALVPCFEPIRAFCPIALGCGLRSALDEARRAFLAVLDRYTLADLIGQPGALAKLLTRAQSSAT